MCRHGFTEECYFDYTFSPIRGESGSIDGIFNAVVETTSRVIGERRLRTLRELATWKTGRLVRRLKPVLLRAAVLQENNFDIPFAVLYLLDDDQRTAKRASFVGLNPDARACPVQIDLAIAESAYPFALVVNRKSG